ncbi:hypothetical protein Lfu02_76450 [Longispora fulva]|uniref:PLL-like beta propeller domain-containing protein n=1 Tax=Longispora fulva TaxID=619741 RepID=A0A8J7GMW9_9ACTN|nr:hypothetical protein [Longispora fulva]MBG6138425.1 hypothetical protein [Longispora fulva]GIG63273.1 hypothetical protein Lfu02_76450 [Longispora fulva]
MNALTRRLLASFAATAALSGTLLAAVTPAHAAFTSTAGGTISRAEIIERAQYWVDHQPGDYNQGASSPGPTGDRNYRRDCSGLVDMAWHLDTDPSTQGLPNISTEIARTNLQAGDILDSYYNHVILFNAWEADHVHYSYYAFGATPVHFVSHASITDTMIDSHPENEYKAYRYNKIATSAPTASVRNTRVVRNTAGNSDEAFGVGTDGLVYHSWSTTPGVWSGWASLPGATFASDPTVVYSPVTNSLEVVARGTDGIMYDNRYTPAGGWSGWLRLPTNVSLVGNPTSVYNPDTNSVVVYSIGSDGLMYQSWNAGAGWSNWSGLPNTATFLGSPAAVYNPTGHTVDVFGKGTNAYYYVTRYSTATGWSNWVTPADTATFAGSPAAVYNATTGRSDVFGVGTDGIMYHSDSSTGAWTNWTSPRNTATFVGAPVIAYNSATGTEDVFGVGTDGYLYHSESGTSSWSNWSTPSYAATFAGSPGLLYNAAANSEDVFGVGTNGIMYHSFKTGTGNWSGWNALGTQQFTKS